MSSAAPDQASRRMRRKRSDCLVEAAAPSCSENALARLRNRRGARQLRAAALRAAPGTQRTRSGAQACQQPSRTAQGTPHAASWWSRRRVAVLVTVPTPPGEGTKWYGPSTSTASCPPGHVTSTSTMRDPSPTGADACAVQLHYSDAGNGSNVGSILVTPLACTCAKPVALTTQA